MKTQSEPTWMIYGANGFTGRLVVEEAKRKGLFPILAGRNVNQISTLAREHDLEARCFSLSNPEEIVKNLTGVSLILNCAGPFSATHKALYKACLETGTHYLDITGEIPVFLRALNRQAEIRDKNIVVIPGVGYDIVPSDCLAALLKREMPDATHLNLGIKFNARTSKGTLKTIIEGLPAGGLIRRDGNLTMVKPAYEVRKIRFDGEEESAVTIPWADVATAFFSTTIPNIQVYMATSASQIKMMKAVGMVRWAFLAKPVQKAFQWVVDQCWETEELSEVKKSQRGAIVWAEGINSKGERIEKRLKTSHPYYFTAVAAVSAVRKVLAGEVPPGSFTPSQAFGPEFVLGLEGASLV